MTQILVTGASGFVGRFLLEKLCEIVDQDTLITAIYNSNQLIFKSKKINDRIRWVNLDLLVDDIDDYLYGVNVVFHLAGVTSFSNFKADIELMRNINVNVTKKIAKKSRLHGVTQFIFVSSISACEISSYTVINEDNGSPCTEYGLSKLDAELYLKSLASPHFNVTILRPSALYGEYHMGSMNQLVKSIKSGLFAIFGDGSNNTNFYYIGDFINVLLGVMLNPKAYNDTFICSDEPLPILKLISLIKARTKSNSRIIKLPCFVGLWLGRICDCINVFPVINIPFSEQRYNAMVRDLTYSNIRLKSVLPSTVVYGHELGLARTIKWYSDNNLI